MTIGEAIKKARKDRGYSRERLARACGIARETIRKWEDGENSPTLVLLIPVANVLKISLDELVGRSNR